MIDIDTLIQMIKSFEVSPTVTVWDIKGCCFTGIVDTERTNAQMLVLLPDSKIDPEGFGNIGAPVIMSVAYVGKIVTQPPTVLPAGQIHRNR
jgi:hypothetical protein